MTKSPKQRYRVVEVRSCFPSWTDATDRLYQYISLKPIHEETNEGFVVRSMPPSPNIDNVVQLCCWQDQQTFTVGQEIYLTVETVK